ncbi:MAG: 5-(carboxyamino)imidazole ribonucleotide synthase [Armatimonadota bacterium]|nr:5-(carboxyamino)imidazole ribonucleotide synthase [bacterium]MDW8321244.1 5-(carboxyamino)imidazole ribonucleotide synthase [Armatimonadota bacterium]
MERVEQVGVLGGGQLGRMLALAGYPLGIRTALYDPEPAACAGQVAPLLSAPYDHWHLLQQFVQDKQCITYEFENVPLRTAQWLAERVPVRPTPRALELFQDRLSEKRFLRDSGIPVPRFAEVDIAKPLSALESVGCPCVVKTRRFGYDGKGQVVARSEEQFLQAVRLLQAQPLIAEELVPFDREVSVLGVRSLDGEVAIYPLVENHHREGILRLSLAPAPNASEQVIAAAQEYVTRLLQSLDYVGIVAIEMFQVGEQLLANEVAPRVHNSGHWTIEGAETSQFENHLRAICGFALGSTAPRGFSAMVNLIGELPPVEKVLAIPNAHLHLYGKQPRPGRKIGHITIRADSPGQRNNLLEEVFALYPPGRVCPSRPHSSQEHAQG